MLEDVAPDGHNTAFNDGLERFSAAGMVDLHMVCPRFRNHANGVFHNRYAAFRFECFAARVQHRRDRHASGRAVFGNFAKVFEHLIFIIRTQFDGFFDGANQHFGVGIKAERHARREKNDQTDIGSVIAMACPDDAFMNHDGIGATVQHFADCGFHDLLAR